MGRSQQALLGPGSLLGHFLGKTDEALLGQWVTRVNESDPVATLTPIKTCVAKIILFGCVYCIHVEARL